MAARKRRRVHRRGRKRSAARRPRVRVSVNRPRRRRRRNWAVAGPVIPMNPRRRRRSHRRTRVHHRRRSNPFFSGMPPIKSIAFGAIGFAGPSFVSGFLSSTFPTVMQQTTSLGIAGKYLVKIGSILGLSWLTRRFVGSSEAQMVMIGGGANVALSLVQDFAPGLLPANPLGMYLPTVFPPMANAPSRAMSAYVPLRGLRAGRPITSAAAFPTTSSTGMLSPAYGGVAARFKRF
jgi:hypothetical protein